jgi:hypothetical protein
MGQKYDLALGKGWVRMGLDGKPGLLVWINIYDVFVHDPHEDQAYCQLKVYNGHLFPFGTDLPAGQN